MNKPIDIASRVRRILSARDLTLYQVSRQSAQIFGRSSPYYVPQDFYSALAARNSSPSIHQFISLSRISQYRLCDWLAVFAFSLDDILRLQILFQRRRTVLLDSSVYDENQWIPWFTGRARISGLSAITPLAQVLKPHHPTRASRLLALNTCRFLYAKIGKNDVLAFPELAPGSIARIDARNAAHWASELAHAPSNRIFVVETDSGLLCGHLRRITGNRVALCSTSFSCPPLELTLGRNTRIIGVIDAEIRLMPAGRVAATASGRARATMQPPAGRGTTATLGQLIQTSRMRTGLSFREASSMSRSVARMLSDRTYFASPGTLSDYERIGGPPRHIQKILSLCILYCIGFWDFLRAGELVLDLIGSNPMPDELCGRTGGQNFQEEHLEQDRSRAESADFLSALIDQWKEIPLFIHRSLPEITGLPRLSLLDFFWIGAGRTHAEPRLVNAALAVVNRRLKKPMRVPPTAPPEQPVYMMVGRDGDYQCGWCTLERSVLGVHRLPLKPPTHAETESRADAEIIGQVTAILRRLP